MLLQAIREGAVIPLPRLRGEGVMPLPPPQAVTGILRRPVPTRRLQPFAAVLSEEGPGAVLQPAPTPWGTPAADDLEAASRQIR